MSDFQRKGKDVLCKGNTEKRLIEGDVTICSWKKKRNWVVKEAG